MRKIRWSSISGLFQWTKKHPVVTTATVLFGYLSIGYMVSCIHRKYKKYPPGPIGFPIIGSVLSLAIYSDKFFINLANKYPKLSTYTLGTTTMISINDLKLAKYILSQKWCHHRNPHLIPYKKYPVAFSDISGKEWIDRRAAFHKYITVNVTEEDIKEMLHGTMNNVDIEKVWFPRKTFVEFIFAMFFRILYGTDPNNDSIQERQKKLEFQRLVPQYIKLAAVGILATMIYVPFGKWVRNIGNENKWRIQMLQMVKEWQLKYKTNTLPAPDVFTTFMAGTDTTGVTLDSCIVHLCKYPKLQQLIYSNIKENDDTMLSAFVYELLRIMPAVPMGLPRYITEDQWIDDKYFIPKGCNVHPNIVGINYNEKLFVNPYKFDIYRWLKRNETDSKWIIDKEKKNNLSSFAFGKRDCVGKVLAKKILNVVLIELISKYHFSFSNGIHPNKVKIKFAMDLVYHIEPEIGVIIKERG